MGTGLVLLLSLVIPLRQSLPKVLTDSLPQLTAPAQEDTEQIYQQAVLEQVQVQAAQYVTQQAEKLGIQCTVSVVAAAGKDGEIVIQSIGIVTDSPVSAQKCTELRAKLSNDLGITDDCIDIM